MGVRVAYGSRKNIENAIKNGVIPQDSIVLTNDTDEAELFFYDVEENLKSVSYKKKFATITEAQDWAHSYDCSGNIIAVHNGSDWVPYIVLDDKSLSPSSSNGGHFEINVIDGGNAAGID